MMAAEARDGDGLVHIIWCGPVGGLKEGQLRAAAFGQPESRTCLGRGKVGPGCGDAVGEHDPGAHRQTPGGRNTDVERFPDPPQVVNASVGMSNASGMDTVVREEDQRKAMVPMLVTVCGMAMV